MAYSRIRPRRGNLYEWSTVNPILEEGELALEYAGDAPGSGLCKFKVGNGTSKYSELDYAFDGASASSIHGGTATSTHMIQMRSDTAANWSSSNVILALGEIGYDSTNNCIKVGDGTSVWNKLNFVNVNNARGAANTGCIFDFGSEDIDKAINAEENDINVRVYPETGDDT